MTARLLPLNLNTAAGDRRLWVAVFLLLLLATSPETAGAQAPEPQSPAGESSAEEDPPAPVAPPPFTGYSGGVATPAAKGQAPRLRPISRTKFDGAVVSWTILGAAAAAFLIGPGLLAFHFGSSSPQRLSELAGRSLLAAAAISLVWAMWGYTLAFSRSTVSADATAGEKVEGDPAVRDGNRFVGGWRHLLLQGMSSQLAGSSPEYPLRRPWDGVPHLLFMAYQMMFCIAAAAPLTAALAPRVGAGGFLIYLSLWVTAIYAPIAYWTWGAGWHAAALDSAGALAAHVNVGFAAAAAAIVLRKSRDSTSPDDVGRTYQAGGDGPLIVGAILFWAGSLLWSASRSAAPDGIAASSFLSVHMAACAGVVAWGGLDWAFGTGPGPTSYAKGAVAGLVAVAAASGVAAAESAIIIGMLGAAAVRLVDVRLCRSLAQGGLPRVFAFHGVGGALGVVLAGVFATPSVAGAARNGDPIGGLISGNAQQLAAQLVALGSAAALAFGVGLLLAAVMRFLVRRRTVAPTSTTIARPQAEHAAAS